MNDASMAGGIAGVVDNINSSTTLYVCHCSNTGAVIEGRVGGIVGAVYCVSNGGGGRPVLQHRLHHLHLQHTKIFSAVSSATAGAYQQLLRWAIWRPTTGTTWRHRWSAATRCLLSNCQYGGFHRRPLRCLARPLALPTADFSPAVHITNCFWLPNPSNSDITQPYDPSVLGHVNMFAVSAAQPQVPPT